jgi:GntR family transcriptional regulator
VKRERVKDYLLDLIDELAPGQPIPSERQLCEQLDVSRPTLRAAIDELARAGMLVRQHGRGTFTSPHKVTQQLSPTTTSSFYVPPAEGTWASEVLEFGTIPAGPRLGHRLQVSPASEVLRIVRRRIVDDEPMAIERLHLPAPLVPGLTPTDLETGNFYQLLRLRYEIVVTDAVQTIEPTVTDESEALLLGVPHHAPALLFERLTRDANGHLIEFAHSLYRGDRYRITSHLTFDSHSG